MADSQPWRDGIWVEKDGNHSYIMVITGSKYEAKGFVHFDYPDVKAAMTGTLASGDFGETPELIRELTGVERFSVQMKTGKYTRLLTSLSR